MQSSRRGIASPLGLLHSCPLCPTHFLVPSGAYGPLVLVLLTNCFSNTKKVLVLVLQSFFEIYISIGIGNTFFKVYCIGIANTF